MNRIKCVHSILPSVRMTTGLLPTVMISLPPLCKHVNVTSSYASRIHCLFPSPTLLATCDGVPVRLCHVAPNRHWNLSQRSTPYDLACVNYNFVCKIKHNKASVKKQSRNTAAWPTWFIFPASFIASYIAFSWRISLRYSKTFTVHTSSTLTSRVDHENVTVKLCKT